MSMRSEKKRQTDWGAARPWRHAGWKRAKLPAEKPASPISDFRTLWLTKAGQLYTVSECLTSDASAADIFTLAELEKSVSPVTALTLIHKVADALAAASQTGLVHKRLRPEVIIVRPDGDPALLELDIPSSQPGAHRHNHAYASPEQQQGRMVDSRSNIYTLGVILYELLHGSRPDPAANGSSPPGSPETNHQALSSQTSRVVANCCQEQVWARYQNLAELMVAIDQALLAERDSEESDTAPLLASGSKETRKAPRQRMERTSLRNSQWPPVIAIVLFLTLLSAAMIDAWTGDSDQANIPVVEQLPLLDSENSLAEQMAEAAAATSTPTAAPTNTPPATPTPPLLATDTPPPPTPPINTPPSPTPAPLQTLSDPSPTTWPPIPTIVPPVSPFRLG